LDKNPNKGKTEFCDKLGQFSRQVYGVEIWTGVCSGWKVGLLIHTGKL